MGKINSIPVRPSNVNQDPLVADVSPATDNFLNLYITETL